MIQKILLLFVAIIIASIIFVGITNNSQAQAKDSIQLQDTPKSAIIRNQNVMIKNQNIMIKNQDTLKKGKNSILKNQDTLKRDVTPAKNAEYLEWQQRSKNIDKNFEKMDRQSMLMDSLLNAKPKPAKRKTP